MLDLVLLALFGVAGVVLAALALLLVLAGAGAVTAGTLLERIADWLIPGRKTGLGTEGLVGEEARVVRALRRADAAAPAEGTVRLAGELWRATAPEEIVEGARARVEAVDGLTLLVSPLDVLPASRAGEPDRD